MIADWRLAYDASLFFYEMPHTMYACGRFPLSLSLLCEMCTVTCIVIQMQLFGSCMHPTYGSRYVVTLTAQCNSPNPEVVDAKRIMHVMDVVLFSSHTMDWNTKIAITTWGLFIIIAPHDEVIVYIMEGLYHVYFWNHLHTQLAVNNFMMYNKTIHQQR